MNQTVVDYCRTMAWSRPVCARTRRMTGPGSTRRTARSSAISSAMDTSANASDTRTGSSTAPRDCSSTSSGLKLKFKSRDGTQVHKSYYPPATLCNRLLDSDRVSEAVKRKLRAQFEQFDPELLLRDIRVAQQVLSDFASSPTGASMTSVGSMEVTAFVDSLATAWKAGEVRPTHRKSPLSARGWRTRADPFEHAWGAVESWLDDAPGVEGKSVAVRMVVAVLITPAS